MISCEKCGFEKWVMTIVMSLSDDLTPEIDGVAPVIFCAKCGEMSDTRFDMELITMKSESVH